MSHKPVILVVDDDAPILMLMQNLLREFGFLPLTAQTGAKAVEIVREHRPDLILLDRNMPGMSGDQVIVSVRSEQGLERVPILILSGEPMERDELKRIRADGAVQKPFDISVLVEKIRSHLAGGTA